jgi:hypothetical protein
MTESEYRLSDDPNRFIDGCPCIACERGREHEREWKLAIEKETAAATEALAPALAGEPRGYCAKSTHPHPKYTLCVDWNPCTTRGTCFLLDTPHTRCGNFDWKPVLSMSYPKDAVEKLKLAIAPTYGTCDESKVPHTNCGGNTNWTPSPQYTVPTGADGDDLPKKIGGQTQIFVPKPVLGTCDLDVKTAGPHPQSVCCLNWKPLSGILTEAENRAVVLGTVPMLSEKRPAPDQCADETPYTTFILPPALCDEIVEQPVMPIYDAATGQLKVDDPWIEGTPLEREIDQFSMINFPYLRFDSFLVKQLAKFVQRKIDKATEDERRLHAPKLPGQYRYLVDDADIIPAPVPVTRLLGRCDNGVFPHVKNNDCKNWVPMR